MANELIYSTDTDNLPIAVAVIAAMYKEDAAVGAGTEYRLVFQLASGYNRIWTYSDATKRNTAYTAILTQYGFSTAS